MMPAVVADIVETTCAGLESKEVDKSVEDQDFITHQTYRAAPSCRAEWIVGHCQMPYTDGRKGGTP